MDSSDRHYVHGTEAWEQRRLSRLNALLNASSLHAMELRGGERVLDIGSGLGQFTRLLARRVGDKGQVLGIERDPEQRVEAVRQAREAGEEHLLDLREGDAADLPLADHEWGTFDVVHARFVLEHVTDPLAVVQGMVRAASPGGRIVLEDDDHATLRLCPEPPGVMELWQAYYETYARQGKDPKIGRQLISLLHQAGAKPQRNQCLFFGTSVGNPNFEAMIDNFIGIIDGARKEILTFGLSDEKSIDDGLAALAAWTRNPDAAMWYTTCWAEAVRPGVPTRLAVRREAAAPREPIADIAMSPEETTVMRFLMAAAAQLSSSLDLDEVFHRIATGLRPLIDYQLFCVMLWNEKTQQLENSFSTKFGEVVPQKGGFPLGYGISGSAAALRRPIRVSNVGDDPRYVRFRHPEVEIKSELAIPLVFGDQLIGVIDLESTELDYFTEYHQQMLSALASNIATALVNARMHARVLRDEQRFERELNTAREIQRGLLPRATPRIAGLEIGAACMPARELGGDFYDFLRYPDGSLAFAVGDAAGKATPAALMAAMAVGMLRGHVMEQPGEPTAVLRELNAQLEQVGLDGQFVALTYGLYDPQTRRLQISNAGLPHALLVRAGRIEEIAIDGVPLGLLSDREYAKRDVEIESGDVVVVCSDGLTEAENEREESFDTERLQEVVEKLLPCAAQQMAEGLSHAALDFAGGAAFQRDDYTVVVLKFV